MTAPAATAPEESKVPAVPVYTEEEVRAAAKVIDSLLVYFTHDFPWASMVYYCMERIPKPGIGTMGVSVKLDRLYLYYEPSFVLSLDRQEIGFVMIHEALHVMLHHCTKRGPHDKAFHSKWNIAADLAINSLIPRSSTCVMPSHKKDLLKKDGTPATKPDGSQVKKGERMGVLPVDHKLEDKRAMEWYFDALPEQPEGSGDGTGETYGEMDSHGEWEPSELVDQEIRNVVERIEKNRQWGSLAGGVDDMIKAAQVSEVPWYKVLRHMLGDLMSKSKIKTSKRLNRRVQQYPFKGEIKTGVDRKLVAFDTSGSVGGDELEKFLSEVNRLVEDEQPVDTICFDYVIQGKVQPFVRSKSKFNFKGRGGTAFTPVVEFAKKNRYKHLIIFTDGQAECPPHVPGLDILWILTPDGNDAPPAGAQGRHLKMKKLKNKSFR